RILLAAALLTTMLATQAAAQLLNLDSARETPKVTDNHVAARLATISAQISDLTTRAAAERNANNRLALLAQLRARQVAVQLLTTPDNVITINHAQQVLQGLTLADTLAVIDGALEKFAADARMLDQLKTR